MRLTHLDKSGKAKMVDVFRKTRNRKGGCGKRQCPP